MSGGTTSPEEVFAANAIGRLLGVAVEPLDVRGAAPRTPDFLVHYPDGTVGVLEVTTVTTTADRRLSARLAGLGHRAEAPGSLNWFVTVSTDAALDWVLRNAAEVVPRWEAHNVHDSADIPLLRLQGHGELELPPAGVNFAGPFPVTDGRVPQLWLHPSPITAVYDDQTDVITPALQDALNQQDNLLLHVKKLQDWSAARRLLFLLVDLEGLPPAATMELNPLTHVPTGVLHLPDLIDEVWVRPWNGAALLRATTSGWEIFDRSQYVD